MKKVVLCLFILLTIAPSYGQDTVTEANSCYMYFPHTVTLRISDRQYYLGSNVFWETVADTGTMIYGVSIRGYCPLDSAISISLATKENFHYTFYDTVWIDSSSLVRYFKCRGKEDIFFYLASECELVEQCSEAYFHRPWLMTDTFYVVARFRGYRSLYDNDLHKVTTIGLINDTVSQRLGVVEGDGVPSFFTNEIPPGNAQWWKNHWGFEFPILEPDRTRCRRPSGLRMRERGNGWAVLQWNSGSGDSYRVTVEGPDDTVVYETADTTLRLDSLAPEAFYWVKLQSLCRYQHYSYDSTLLNPGVAQFGFRNLITGVSGADADLRVEVYPNPANGCLVLEAGDDSPVRAVLTDLGGREVMAVDFRATATLDVSRLAAGPYLLRLTTPAATTVRKVVVQ